LTPRDDIRPFTSKFRPVGKETKDEEAMKASESFRRAKVYDLLPPPVLPQVPNRPTREAACCRLNRIEITVGQQWILRVKLNYRFVTTDGETVDMR